MKKLMLAVMCGVLSTSVQAADLKTETAIKAQFAALEKAFNAGDAKGIAALFAEDGDLYNPGGVYASGRADIEKVAAGDLAHIIAGGTSTFTVLNWRSIGKDLVLANATHDFKGSKGPMAEGHVIVTTVFAKRAGQWLCIAARPFVPMTPPAAPATAPAASAPATAPAATTAATAPATAPAKAATAAVPAKAGGMGK